ncbi:MAG TPA: N-methyl-L-tryptophan oxidase [Capsulimonadaceae bacterium]|nr:N-methyl-L-tryptophan oxidase [Capsulimonadaceae bacterium]
MKVAIIGAGVVGTMAAWQLARSGNEVVVLEQFRLDHDKGSSFGDSRVVRQVYPDRFYTELMAESYALWDELQAACPQDELFFRAGGLFFGPREHPQMQEAASALNASGVEHEVWDAAETRRRYPRVALQPGEIALYEPSMGYARASNAVRAAAELAREAGATIRVETRVAGVEQASAGTAVRLITHDGQEFIADRLLLCAGPWSGPLLASLGIPLPFTVTRQTYLHLIPVEGDEEFEAGRFPVWIDAGTNYYGFPRIGSLPGVKIAHHFPGDKTTPEEVERTVSEADKREIVRYASARFPGLSSNVGYDKVCLYTMTPDEDFVIDSVPSIAGAWFIAGLSGHGFKFGPLLGKIGSDLALGTPVRYDVSRFRASRF